MNTIPYQNNSLNNDLPSDKASLLNAFHEIYNADGQFRKGYEELLPYFNSLPTERMVSIRKRIDFVLKEQGVTFGEFTPNGIIEKTWSLDMIPHIINEEEFKKIEMGVQQRVKALNLFLLDIYSNQKILRDKIIPYSIVFKDNSYLRECINIKIPNDVYLHFGAFDLMRSKEGSYLVVDDNVTIPSGVSYGLLNRQILRQQFPNLFNKMQIQQIWDTASMMLAKLRECAPKNSETPNVVLLTPGIYNEAYSEHELLANRMGIPLVLPKDLIVRENFVYMKTVYGLSRVDVIYRRIADSFIDPVIFYQDSVLGVPGIFSCVRKGNVTIANAVGSGVASSKALLPYSDKIIRYYLQEDSIIKTIPTYNLTEEKNLKMVVSQLEKYVIKPIQGSGGIGTVIGSEIPSKEIELLKEAIKKHPEKYVAQDIINPSISNIFKNSKLQKRYVETRFFSFYGQNIHISSCALTRVSPSDETFIVTNSRGGGSKDTWIMGLSEKNSPRFVLTSIKNRSKNFLLSRVAESLFWLGRYVNRAYTTANVLQVAYTSEIDILMGKNEASFLSLVRCISRLTGSPLKKLMKEKEPWHLSIFKHAVMDSKNSYSMKSNLTYAMSNAREIQNMLSNDMWISLKKLLEYIANTPGEYEENSISMEDLSEWLTGVIHYSQSFYGAALDTFSRQDVLQFIQLGRLIEHCNSIIMVIRSTIHFMISTNEKEEIYNNLQPFIIVLLKFLNSHEAYQWNYESRFDPYLAFRMLVIDRDFNNSLVSCLEKIKDILYSVNVERLHADDSPEAICDLLISRALSFDLRGKLAFSDEKSHKLYTRGRKFYANTNNEISSGFWASDLKTGIELLGSKIMDRYSNILSTTPFTVME
jgi:uncharacterized circularly permuted ATP-grasp superfamily protein/uncharacterized alpha-E superfamily protein